MNPTFLNNMSWEMAEVYGAITDQILVNLARYFPYYNAGNVPKSAFTYQAAMLAQMGQVNADTIRIIRNGLKDANSALGNVLEQTIIDAVSKAEPRLIKAVKAGLLQPAGVPIVAPNQMRAFQLYYEQAADKLNLVNTVMLESTKQAYQACVSDVVADIELADRVNATYTALDVATGETITGVSSWNQAMRHAMDRLKNRGITGFIDHGGHRWSAETYVAMDIRTTVYNTARASIWETNQNFGNDLYIVSYHDGARPLCYPWQNKVISSTNNARTVIDLDGNEIEVHAQSETSYGEAAGLFGINCKHYPTPFIPGVSAVYDEANIPSEKENEKVYEETQQQRAMERKLREQKRDLMMAKAQGADDEEIKALRAECRKTSDEIDTFCEETGLPRRQNREGVFTQRDFPDANKYDVTEFENKQKEEIEKYFSGGGAQQGYKFGTMTPKEPIVPTTPPVAPVAVPAPALQNVASQATTKIYTEDMFDNVAGMKKDAQRAMAQKLLASGNNDAIQIFGKYADELKIANPRVRTRAYFSPMQGGIAVSVKNAMAGSSYEMPFQVLFHEFGHNIDWLAGGKNAVVYLSNRPVNGVRLVNVIQKDFDDFMKSMGASTNAELINMLKAEGMDEKTRGNISDILEKCTGKSYPLGLGHGASYHARSGATEKEFFAEVLDSSIANAESYAQMRRLFPNAVNMVWEMIRGAI